MPAFLHSAVGHSSVVVDGAAGLGLHHLDLLPSVHKALDLSLDVETGTLCRCHDAHLKDIDRAGFGAASFQWGIGLFQNMSIVPTLYPFVTKC